MAADDFAADDLADIRARAVFGAGQRVDQLAGLQRLDDTLRAFAEALGRDLDAAARGLGHSATGRALSHASADCARFVARLDHLAGRTGGEQWRSTDGDHSPHATRQP